MSSVHIDGSGARPLTFTMNDSARTSAQFSTKPDDDLSVQVGGENGQLEFVTLARLVTLEQLDADGYEPGTFVRLTVDGRLHGRFTKIDPEKHGWPHATISARKGIDQPSISGLTAVRPAGSLAEVLAVMEFDRDVEAREGSPARAALRYAKSIGTEYEAASLANLREALEAA